MKSKLPRFFQPSMRLYFIFLIIFAVATFFIGSHSRILAAAEVVVLIFLALYSRITSKIRTAKLQGYLESMTDGMDSVTRDTPLPVVIFNSETSYILWSNDRFNKVTGGREHFFEVSVSDIVPGFSIQWLLEGKIECPEPVSIGDRCYKVYGCLSRSAREFGGHEIIATTYWIDITEYAQIRDEYINSRPVFAIITLDNYEELLKGLSEKEKSALLSNIDEKIGEWAGDGDGYLCKYDRDRYFFLFEEKDLGGFVENKFSLLDTVRADVGAGGVHATLSIGIGKDGKTPQENFRFASLGVEMALSRGGDQAVIKNKFGFEFFGGHSQQLEKRTKVKSRVMASAFGELVGDASSIFVMGHKAADFDTVGAAAGVCCIARARGKPAYIVLDMENNFSQSIIGRLLSAPDYKDTFISAQDAILAADSKSLLVVVDTSRPEKVESETLLLSCNRIAVIDHHRRAATYIDNAILNFHEPYASSASELVTEMLQYLVDKSAILRAEAEALLTGMVLDTKGFAIHTGSRTFDAASFLRRAGADTTEVKRLMQSDIDTATSRFALIRDAQIYRDGIALASADTNQGRLSIAQAADELLNIAGVHASFVAAKSDGDIFISGRSIGIVNVQVILEKLGGGGNQSTAGVQIHGSDVVHAIEDLKKSIDEYLENDGHRQILDRR